MIMKELGWPLLSKRREYYKLTQMFKIMNNLVPQYLIDSIPPLVGNVNYNLRNAGDITIPRYRTLSYKRSFIPSSINLWNCLDNNLRSSPSLLTFKSNLKRNLFPQPSPLFRHGKGRAPKLHAQMRMGLSGLNFHRKKFYTSLSTYLKF